MDHSHTSTTSHSVTRSFRACDAIVPVRPLASLRMDAEHTIVDEFVRALFAYEFLDGGADHDAIEQIHRGEIDDWVDALDRSGMFDEHTVGELAARWHAQPKLLFDALIADADEVTRRRCETAWAALDRLAPLAQLG